MRNCILMVLALVFGLMSMIALGGLFGLVLTDQLDAADKLGWAILGLSIGSGICAANIRASDWQ